jgi:protocatechuate 3,4-dioxygenase beta subunit
MEPDATGHCKRFMDRRLIPVLAVVVSSIAILAGGTYAGIRGSKERPAAAAVSGAGPSSRCSPTPGDHSQGPPTAGADTPSTVRLGPGMDLPVTADAIAISRKGQPLVLSGVVRGRDCRPLSGATIQVWHTDADGDYGPGHGTSGLRCCYLTGLLRTDSEGRYRIETVMPGHYRGVDPPPPAHIHFAARHPQAGQILTELDFAGDPYLGTALPALIVPLTRVGETLEGSFDLVL